MRNAKEEFLEDTYNLKIICAQIWFGDYEFDGEVESRHVLKKGYSAQEYKYFVDSLDKSYDSGYGGQELFGTIWCEDGVWLSRGEYDGSEWWEENKYPEFSEVVK